MKLEIYKRAPNAKVIDVCHDLPSFNPNASGRLLQALVKDIPEDAIVLAVVDPGVGTDRHALWLEVDGRHFVGPDNGLFARIVNQAKQVNAHIIEYDNTKVSVSFHGRDVFAPVAAKLASNKNITSKSFNYKKMIGLDWLMELPEIIYIDHYGNAMTGITANNVLRNQVLKVKEKNLQYGLTFADVGEWGMFWYENSLGLVELSMRAGSIANELSLKIGDAVQ